MYQIFVSDGVDVAELEVENVDMLSVFSVADIKDLSVRKESIKQLKFIGTKKNNEIFGNLFHLNRINKLTDTISITYDVSFLDNSVYANGISIGLNYPDFFKEGIEITIEGTPNNDGQYTIHDIVPEIVDGVTVNYWARVNEFYPDVASYTGLTISKNISSANKLFFSYNPLITVEAFVYEDSQMLFKGSLRVNSITRTKNETILYDAVITGGFTDFRTVLADKYLSDLDLSEYTHSYNLNMIIDTWYLGNDADGGYGFTYPYIDYGYTFKTTSFTADDDVVNKYHFKNFRPALFVTRYLDKIFSQDGLEGFSWELKSDTDFKERFYNLLIPDSNEEMKFNLYGWNQSFIKSILVTDVNQVNMAQYGNSQRLRLIPFHNTPTTPIDSVSDLFIKYNGYDEVITTNRTITSNGLATAEIINISNGYTGHSATLSFQLVERNKYPSNSSLNWDVIAEDKITLAPSELITSQAFNIKIGERTWQEGKVWALRIVVKSDEALFPLGPYLVEFNVFSASLNLPANNSTQFVTNVIHGDNIVPVAPVNIKQLDFIKGLVNLFNLYVYTEPTNPKHIIFQKYDDYYALAGVQNHVSNAIDWTKKIDYTNGWVVKNNIQIPKSYSFTYKDDGDFINDTYKKKFGEVYGSFSFNDSLGLADTKKVELCFSPTPMVSYAGTQKTFATIYQVDGDKRKPTKSNIRILYYNGIEFDKTHEWEVGDDLNNGGDDYSYDLIFSGLTFYPKATTYYYALGGTPIDSLDFGESKEVYFDNSDSYKNVQFAYQCYYQNQISELTNPNVVYIDCQVLLNEFDIANLNLQIPVFIDLGEFGTAYFKVLEVNYEANNVPSKVSLQKIFF